MKALTLAQPWPLAFTVGKRLENRSWEPQRSMIGEWIALHGGKMPTGAKLEALHDDLEFIAKISKGDIFAELPMLEGVFALARLRWIYRPHETFMPVDEQEFGKWRAGHDQYAWVFSKIIFLPQPVPCRGALKLWDLPRDVHAAVLEAIRPQREALSRSV